MSAAVMSRGSGRGYSQLDTKDSADQVQNRTEGDAGMITVYSKPNCMQCQMSYRVLDAKGLDYTVVDVTENEAALEYVKELGYLTAPVIVVSEHDHWGGFQPDEIARVAAGGAGEDETVEA